MGERIKWDGRDIDMEIDAVEQWSGNLRQVACHRRAGTATPIA